jgi:hypothetical protein
MTLSAGLPRCFARIFILRTLNEGHGVNLRSFYILDKATESNLRTREFFAGRGSNALYQGTTSRAVKGPKSYGL